MYKPNQPAEQYFEEISILAYRIVDDVFWSIHSMGSNTNETEIIKLLPKIRQQVIFEIYYILYNICADTNSIYHYYKEFVDNNESSDSKIEETGLWKLFAEKLENYKYINFKDDEYYNRFQRIYRHYRQDADVTAREYYNINDIGLYEKIDQKYTGHKLNRLDWLFVKRIIDDEDIDFLFDVLRDQRLPSNKKVSNNDFMTRIVLGIDKIYESIEHTDYNFSDNQYRGVFLRCVDYYQLETNCSIELSYMASYALSQSKKTLEEKNADREVFHNLRWCGLDSPGEPPHIIQNKAVAIISDIFGKYIDNNLDAYAVRGIYTYINSIIYLSIRNILRSYFGGSFMKSITSGYWVDIIQGDENIKKELGINSLDDFMCQETQIFFNSYIGKGQHIAKKQWNKIKVKDFREMYQLIF